MKRTRCAVIGACLASGCAGVAPPASPPATLQSLEGRPVPMDAAAPVDAERARAIARYRDFLAHPAPDPMRSEAMRRLGDLEMTHADEAQLGAAAEPAQPPRHAAGAAANYQTAIRTYRDLLRAYPHAPTQDHVLYQLAKAHELAGDLSASLAALNRLVQEHPTTLYRDEAHFRRGEMLFTLKDYGEAERAYRRIIAHPGSPFYERALYMHGWSLFKQAEYESALDSFVGVIDGRLRTRAPGETLAETPALARSERELVEDTFRVLSLSIANLKGVDTLAAVFQRHGARDYEHIAYQQLGELYLKQERIKDAADAYNAFVRRHPTHAQSPLMQVRVIEAYRQGEFASLVLEAKKEFVVRYGRASAYRAHNDDETYARVLPHLRTHLTELAQHYHAQAQKTKRPDDYKEAARWYGAFLASFPDDSQAARINFLYAEMLFEHKQYAAAIAQYENAAYGYPPHAKSADAGYGALLAYAAREKQLAPEARRPLRAQAIDSALRFADANPADARTPPVLADTAEKLYALSDPARASFVARRLLALTPPAGAPQRKSAWIVVAHTDFDSGAYAHAEAAYQEALALAPAGETGRDALVERLAASVYKQAEQARAQGDTRTAVTHFKRVGQVAPSSPVVALADYDAAAVLLSAKDWAAAIPLLEQFRRVHPNHPLQAQTAPKLAAAYLETNQWAKAAAEFERLAAGGGDSEAGRASLWQAAELYEKAGADAKAATVYGRYLRFGRIPFVQSVELHHRIAGLAKKRGDARQQQAWLASLVKLETNGGAQRTERTRALAAAAAITLAEPEYVAFRKVRLVEPLRKNLKIKKDRMQRVLKRYTEAAEYGAVDVATVATYRIADIYHELSRALLASQRPKGLKGDELEQYNVMLEEQAFPFEEKAIEIHEVNAQRAAQGVYDEWVQKSFAALGKLRPVRYAKAEKGEAGIDAIR